MDGEIKDGEIKDAWVSQKTIVLTTPTRSAMSVAVSTLISTAVSTSVVVAEPKSGRWRVVNGRRGVDIGGSIPIGIAHRVSGHPLVTIPNVAGRDLGNTLINRNTRGEGHIAIRGVGVV